MKSWTRFALMISVAAFSVMANAADFKGCRYSKAADEDQDDNATLTAQSCAKKTCVAVVLCDNDTSISNVVCADTGSGCPKPDECMKQHKANGIKYAAHTTPAKAPVKEPVLEEPQENLGR